MKSTHLADRKPVRRCDTRAWWRFCSDESPTCMWRLFRRSEVNHRWFQVSHVAPRNADRRIIAAELRRLRAQLRDRVDAHDLELMGVTP